MRHASLVLAVAVAAGCGKLVGEGLPDASAIDATLPFDAGAGDRGSPPTDGERDGALDATLGDGGPRDSATDAARDGARDSGGDGALDVAPDCPGAAPPPDGPDDAATDTSACVDAIADASACPSGSACTASDGAAGACCNGACCSQTCCPSGPLPDGGTATPRCVDLACDPTNCGACGASWPGATCTMGHLEFASCVGAPHGAACTTGGGAAGTCCSGACRTASDLDKDPANCGECGRACPAGTTCSGGACSAYCPGSSCPADYHCGYLKGYDPGYCYRSSCSAKSEGQPCTPIYTGASAYPTSWCCGGSCTDLSGDRANCGACGHGCSSTEVCVNGACVTAPPCTLTDQFALCPLAGGKTGMCCSGTCVDTMTDTSNCGGCGNSCPAPLACAAPGACKSGGKVALCGGKAPAFTCPAGTVCVGETHCMSTTCSAAGESACNVFQGGAGVCCGAGAGGCPSFATDPNNCGGCGIVCESGVCLSWRGSGVGLGSCFPVPVCSEGCPAACPAGTVCVGGYCVGGCGVGDYGNLCQTPAGSLGSCCQSPPTYVYECADPTSDPMNCGACGVVCPSGSCAHGVCAP